MLFHIKTRRVSKVAHGAWSAPLVDLGKAPEAGASVPTPKVILPLAENNLGKKIGQTGWRENSRGEVSNTSGLIDLGKVPDAETKVPAHRVMRTFLVVNLAEKKVKDEPTRSIPAPRARIEGTMDFSKVTETMPLGRAPALLPSLVIVDLGKSSDREMPCRVLGPAIEQAPVAFDLGKAEEPLQTTAPPPVLSSLAEFDLGKRPEATGGEHQSGRADVLNYDAGPTKVGTPESIGLLNGLTASAGAIMVLGILVAGAVCLHLASHRAAPRSFPLVAYTVDEDDPVSLSPTELRPFQLWSQYGERLEALAPGRSPGDPWWKIAADAGLSPDQSQAVHKLQTDFIAALDRLEKPASDVSNGSLVLIAAAKNQLEQQQIPPTAGIEPRENGGPQPVRDLASFFKPRNPTDLP